MTTSIRKAVYRVTDERVQDRGSKRREIVVGLGPDDVITLRLKGTRQSVTIAVSSVWYYGLRLHAEQLRREKAALRKAKKEGKA